MTDLYIKNVSYSQVGTLMRDPGKWASERLLGQWDNTTTVAMTAGNIAHKFVEHLIRTKGDETKALKRAYECIYTSKKMGVTYIIDPDAFDKPVKELKLQDVLENFKTKKLKFTKSTSMEVLLKKVKGGIDGYLSEKIHYGDILGVEQSMEHEITETILDKTFTLPIPIKVIADQVCRTTDVLNMVSAEKEVITIPEGSIYIEDTKFTDKFKALNVDSGQFFIQAMFLYYGVKKQYGEAPTHCNFRVTKTSKNRDGSSQQQVVTFFYSGDDFEMAKTDFWRYMMRWFELVKFFQEGDVIFNIFDMTYGDEAWAKQRAYYRGIHPDQLKQAISVSNRNKETEKNFTGHSFNLMDKGKEIKEGDVITGEIEIEDIVRTKLLEFGLPIQYEKTNEGYACNQMLFTPGRGIKMSDITNKNKELEQATGIDGIRIEAPVPGTTFIGIEYPRKDRKFLSLSKYKAKKRGLKIPIGKTINGELVEIDLMDSDNPHLLIAGKTGSGKTEELKVIIESLRGKSTISICDPKMVDFNGLNVDHHVSYDEDIYYLLKESKEKMMARYELLKMKGCSDIEEYNKKNKDKLSPHTIIIDEVESITGNKKFIYVGEEGQIYFRERDIPSHSPLGMNGKLLKSVKDPTTKIPFGEEILDYIGSLTKLGRAAGIHIILATQRPSVQVIDGQIKANISTRICLSLGSAVDSKVVIDESGAEKLLGKGDMLFKHNGKIKRLQSFYIPKD